MSDPDFDALRAQRNAKRREFEAQMAADGWSIAHDCLYNHDNACYCACPEGPCEHNWNGPAVEVGEGGWAVTCARCGLDSMSHGLRTGP